MRLSLRRTTEAVKAKASAWVAATPLRARAWLVSSGRARPTRRAPPSPREMRAHGLHAHGCRACRIPPCAGYLSTLASPIAGKFYLDNAERTDQVTVKIITEDDEMMSEVVVQGNDEEIDRFQKTLDLREKGMIYVKGIFDSA